MWVGPARTKIYLKFKYCYTGLQYLTWCPVEGARGRGWEGVASLMGRPAVAGWGDTAAALAHSLLHGEILVTSDRFESCNPALTGNHISDQVTTFYCSIISKETKHFLLAELWLRSSVLVDEIYPSAWMRSGRVEDEI